MKLKSDITLINVLKRLYLVADEFPYSQLALCLDEKNLFDLIRVFGGQKIYIPTVKEFTELLQFCLVEEIGDYKTAVGANKEVFNGYSEAKYHKMLDILHKRIKSPKDRKKNHRRKAEKDKGSEN